MSGFVTTIRRHTTPRPASAILLALALAAWPRGAAAQETGAVEGIVTAKENGRPLAEARVLLVGMGRGTRTDDHGAYRLGGLLPGRYTLQATRLGRVIEAREVTVAAGVTTRADFALAEGSVLLPGVVVSTTRTPLAATRATADVDVVTAEEVRATPARTMDDVLRQVPAVQLPRVSGTVAGAEQILSLRGTDEGRSLVLVDGVPLNDPWGEWIDWSRVPKSLVDHVEIVEGGGSSLYGTYAMGGVVQLFTRPIEARSVTASARAGSRDLHDVALAGSTVRGRWGLSAAGDLTSGGGYTLLSPAQRGAIDEASGASQRSGSLRAEYTAGPAARLFATVSALDEDRDLGTPLTPSDRRIGALSVGGERGTLAAGQWSATLFGSVQRYHSHQARAAADRSTETPVADQSIPNHDLGGSVQWTRAADPRWLLAVGADARRMVGRLDEVTYAAGAPSGARSTGGRQLIGGVFVQGALTPAAPLRIEASARLDGWRNDHGTRVDRTTAPATDTAYAARTDVAFSPRLGLRWAALASLALRASVYKAFRAPTLSEQYRTFLAGPLTFRGNPDLGPERLTGSDVGADWQPHPRVELRATAYWNELRDLAGFVAVSPTERMRRNFGRSRSRGAEGELAVRALASVLVSAAYSYDDARVTRSDNPAQVGTRVARVPLQRASARVQWTPEGRGSYAALVRYEGSNIALGGAPLPPFGVVDLDARYPLPGGAELTLGVQNVGGRDYVANRSGTLEYLGLPRTVVVGVAMRVE